MQTRGDSELFFRRARRRGPRGLVRAQRHRIQVQLSHLSFQLHTGGFLPNVDIGKMPNFFVNRGRNSDFVGVSGAFYSSSHVDHITENIVAL
jgi:hypothetical protein